MTIVIRTVAKGDFDKKQNYGKCEERKWAEHEGRKKKMKGTVEVNKKSSSQTA